MGRRGVTRYIVIDARQTSATKQRDTKQLMTSGDIDTFIGP